MKSGDLRVELYMSAGWVDVSDDVMSATWNRGRASVTEEWKVGGASIVVYDPTRTYDPLNESGTHYGLLTGGVPVRVSVRRGAGDAWTVMFLGVVDRFVPESWSGDTVASTTIECNGKLFDLVVPMPDFVGDHVAKLMGQGRAGCFYTFNFDNDVEGDSFAGGFVEDVSGRGSHGAGYTSVLVPTAGVVDSGTGGIDLTGDGGVVAPLPADLLRSGSEGFLVVMSITMDGNGGSGFHPSYYRWMLFGEGVSADHVTLHIEEELATPSTPAGTDPMKLYAFVEDDSISILTGVLTVGTRADWVNKKRTVYFAADQLNFTFGAASEDGTTIGGATVVEKTQANPYRGVDGGTPQPTWTGNRLTQFGRGWRTDFTGPGFSGEVHAAAAAHAATPADRATAIGAAVVAYGWIPRLTTDRVDTFVDLAGIDPGDWSSTITSTIRVNEYAPVGGRTAIELLREAVAMEQGKLFQEIGGGIVVEDFVAAGTRGLTSAATFTDQPGGALFYLDGSAPITTAIEELINRVTVRTPTGYQVTVTDAASVTAHGLRAVDVSLPFAANSAADDYADLMVRRFKTQRPYITEITVDPDSDPDEWWPQLVARDIGDRVTVERQPLGVGSVSSVESIIEGDMWAWTAEQGFAVTYYFSPAETLGGAFVLDSSTLDGPYILG